MGRGSSDFVVSFSYFHSHFPLSSPVFFFRLGLSTPHFSLPCFSFFFLLFFSFVSLFFLSLSSPFSSSNSPYFFLSFFFLSFSVLSLFLFRCFFYCVQVFFRWFSVIRVLFLSFFCPFLSFSVFFCLFLSFSVFLFSFDNRGSDFCSLTFCFPPPLFSLQGSAENGKTRSGFQKKSSWHGRTRSRCQQNTGNGTTLFGCQGSETKTIYTSLFVRKETRVFVFEESINKMCKHLPNFEIIVFVSGKFLHRFYRPSFHCFTCTSYCFCFRGFSLISLFRI